MFLARIKSTTWTMLRNEDEHKWNERRIERTRSRAPPFWSFNYWLYGNSRRRKVRRWFDALEEQSTVCDYSYFDTEDQVGNRHWLLHGMTSFARRDDLIQRERQAQLDQGIAVRGPLRQRPSVRFLPFYELTYDTTHDIRWRTTYSRLCPCSICWFPQRSSIRDSASLLDVCQGVLLRSNVDWSVSSQCHNSKILIKSSTSGGKILNFT